MGMKPRIILVTDPAFGDDGIVRCIETVGRALPAGSLRFVAGLPAGRTVYVHVNNTNPVLRDDSP